MIPLIQYPIIPKPIFPIFHDSNIPIGAQPLEFLYQKSGLGSNIGHGLFVGWVEHPDIFCWVSFLYPTYLPAIFVLSAKPNKMAEDRAIPQ